MAEGLKLVNAQMDAFNQQLSAARSNITKLNGLTVSSVVSPTMATQSVIQQSGNRTMNIDQTNNIQSPMDIATFQAMFNQVVRMQFGGA
jgi:hypothetical protein